MHYTKYDQAYLQGPVGPGKPDWMKILSALLYIILILVSKLLLLITKLPERKGNFLLGYYFITVWTHFILLQYYCMSHSPMTGSGATRTGSRLVQLFEFDM